MGGACLQVSFPAEQSSWAVPPGYLQPLVPTELSHCDYWFISSFKIASYNFIPGELTPAKILERSRSSGLGEPHFCLSLNPPPLVCALDPPLTSSPGHILHRIDFHSHWTTRRNLRSKFTLRTLQPNPRFSPRSHRWAFLRFWGKNQVASRSLAPAAYMSEPQDSRVVTATHGFPGYHRLTALLYFKNPFTVILFGKSGINICAQSALFCTVFSLSKRWQIVVNEKLRRKIQVTFNGNLEVKLDYEIWVQVYTKNKSTLIARVNGTHTQKNEDLPYRKSAAILV